MIQNTKNLNSIEFLVSTMYLRDINEIDKLNIKSKAVVVNQTDNLQQVFYNETYNVINTLDRGLSKSRNLCLEKSTSDILVFSDNDIIFLDNSSEIIRNYHEKYPQYEVIIFYVQKYNHIDKPIYNKDTRIGYIRSMKMYSMGLTIKKSVFSNKLRFDPNFGAGAKYSMGEENILLFDLLKTRAKIVYVPVKIAKLLESESTWFRGFNEKYFFDKGAIFYRMSRFFWFILVIQFIIRKYSLYKKNFSIFKAFIIMRDGMIDFKTSKKDE